MNKIYKSRFNSQKYSAAKRSIVWHFTFEEWINWWGDDIVNRGRNKGQLVMARRGDTGAYHPDNVYKVDTSINSGDPRRGKSALNSKAIMTPLGRFDCLTDAAKAHGIVIDTIRRRVISNNDYYYI
jgi:hypothetical protein